MSRQSLAGLVVVELLAVGDDADLAARLDRVGLLDAREAAGRALSSSSSRRTYFSRVSRRAPGRLALMASAAATSTV